MRLSLLPVLLIFVVSLTKSIYIASHFTPIFSISSALHILLGDLSILIIVGTLSILTASTESRNVSSYLVSLVASLLASLTLIWYLLDSLSVILLHARPTPHEFAVYFVDAIATSMAKLAVVSILLLAILISRNKLIVIRMKMDRLPTYTLCGALLFLLILNEIIFDPKLPDYSSKVSQLYSAGVIIGETPPRFSMGELASIKIGNFEEQPIQFEGDPPDIILLVIESLSCVDSMLCSSIGDRLPLMDSIGQEGIYFNNFFANHTNSEGGWTGLLSGRAPLQYPTSSWDLYKSYRKLTSLADHLNFSWHTQFLASTSLRFRGQYDYLSHIGFERIEDLDHSEFLINFPRYSLDAPSDSVLYRRIIDYLSEVSSYGAPIALIVATSSSHPPYIDPLGRAPTDENRWNYIDQTVYGFYRELKETGFLEEGLLVITSDHRKMEPISTREREVFGGSAGHRVPLIIVGDRVNRTGVDNRYFQQQDLIRMLPQAISEQEKPLSEFITLISRYSKPVIGERPEELLVIIDSEKNAKNPHKIRSFGSQTTFISEVAEPTTRELIIDRIQKKKAMLQLLSVQN